MQISNLVSLDDCTRDNYDGKIYYEVWECDRVSCDGCELLGTDKCRITCTKCLQKFINDGSNEPKSNCPLCETLCLECCKKVHTNPCKGGCGKILFSCGDNPQGCYECDMCTDCCTCNLEIPWISFTVFVDGKRHSEHKVQSENVAISIIDTLKRALLRSEGKKVKSGGSWKEGSVSFTTSPK